jgi:hypothetical protein
MPSSDDVRNASRDLRDKAELRKSNEKFQVQLEIFNQKDTEEVFSLMPTSDD